MSQRFRSSSRNSYWGNGYLEMAVSPKHFLHQLKELMDWERVTQDLADCYKGGAEYGPVP